VLALLVVALATVAGRAAIDDLHATQQDAALRARAALLASQGPDCRQVIGYARIASGRFAEAGSAAQARAQIALCADYLATTRAVADQEPDAAARAWQGVLDRHPGNPLTPLLHDRARDARGQACTERCR
jgi:hypothetical protein